MQNVLQSHGLPASPLLPSPIGLAEGVLPLAGTSAQHLLQSLDSLAFVEVGPTTLDPQYGKAYRDQRIRIEGGEVRRLSRDFNPSCQQMVSSLVRRQELIRDTLGLSSSDRRRRALMRSVDKKLGVCVNASRETANTVPYLTHQDFIKQIRDLTDMCDFLVLNLTAPSSSMPSGLEQYYRNLPSLDKLLRLTAKARDNELGKVAAVEYEDMEAAAGHVVDYQVSVKRHYSRNSIISLHRPLIMFVKVDPYAVFQDNPLRCQSFAVALARYCLKYGIDGIVLAHDSEMKAQETQAYQEQLAELIRAVRLEDKEERLTVIAAGCRQ